jgi:Na+/glutamate symporter
MWTADEVGQSIVLLALVFLAAALIRKRSRHLRALFLPTAVIGGFLALALGPEGVGRLTDSNGIFPDHAFEIWTALPGLLINVMSASLLLGERLPPLMTVWSISGAHVIMISVMSMGQYALGGLCVWLLLQPVFGIDSKAAALIEMSFAGGHGTLAGLTPVLQQHGVSDLLHIGLGLATIGAAFNLAGSGFFDTFPLFPFTFLAAVLVQLCASRYGFEWAVNRRAVEGLGGIAMDGVIICAIGTLALAPLGTNIGPLIILAVAAVGWSVFVTLVIGRRIFRRHWFEHSIAEFGESRGMLATGFVMVDMVDPSRQTDVVRGYSYRQIITRPILGGGFMTALAVPLIAAIGLPAFTIAAAAITVALICWGIMRV